jgi:hypothetical protein
MTDPRKKGLPAPPPAAHAGAIPRDPSPVRKIAMPVGIAAGLSLTILGAWSVLGEDDPSLPLATGSGTFVDKLASNAHDVFERIERKLIKPRIGVAVAGGMAPMIPPTTPTGTTMIGPPVAPIGPPVAVTHPRTAHRAK